MCAPATPRILDEFHSDSQLQSTILVSIWELGEVVGPLVVGPLSEIYGRLPVYHIANILFVLFSVAAAGSRNMDMLMAFRFLLGFTVASTTLNSSIVGDMFRPEHRGRALTVMGMTPFIAPVLGPTVGGFLSEAKGWRWTFWFTAIVTGAFEICFLAAYRESYSVAILRRKTRRLQKQTGNKRLRSRYDTGVSGTALLAQSLLRPLQLLFTSPAVLLVSICGAFAISYTYVIITSITTIFEDNYGFSAGPIGLTYLGLGVLSLVHFHPASCGTDVLPTAGFGMISSVVLCGAFLDWYLKRKMRQATTDPSPARPEHRLPPMVLGNVLVPLGLIGFGWTAERHMHWMVPIFCTAVVGFGFVAVSLASWSYLIDAFGIYAASATAATTVLRNVAAAALPLAGPALYARLGLGRGNTVLGAVALAFAPVPVLLMVMGERLRGKGWVKGLGQPV